MATKRPSYLKRQKEQKRLTRANDKREAKRERKRARAEMTAAPENEGMDLLVPSDAAEGALEGAVEGNPEGGAENAPEEPVA